MTGERPRTERVLLRIRQHAYGPGGYVGQQGFMQVDEIRELAGRARIAPGVRVLDLCCGVAGPGRLIAREFGCRYLGVDASPDAIAIARDGTATPECRFEVARVPPLPDGRFDVVLLLETMLAFTDKQTLLHDVRAALPIGGRFACTVEEGAPLGASERDQMPAADTVWPIVLDDLRALLRRTGFVIAWQRDCTQAHLGVVDSLVDAMSAEAPGVEDRAIDDLLTAHRLWSEWLRSGRIRKFAVVAEASSL